MNRRMSIIYVIPRLTVLAVFLLVFTSNTLVGAESSENVVSNVNMPDQGESELSTPELIEQAFVRGEITAEQRILYLTYAVYDYKSLPEQFIGNVADIEVGYHWGFIQRVPFSYL